MPWNQYPFFVAICDGCYKREIVDFAQLPSGHSAVPLPEDRGWIYHPEPEHPGEVLCPDCASSTNDP
jgi:hypothetical protein